MLSRYYEIQQYFLIAMKVINILTNDDLRNIHKLLKSIKFKDGSGTARGSAKQAKNNKEAIQNSSSNELLEMLKSKISENAAIQKRYLPTKFSKPILNLYQQGDFYKRHFDSSHMQIKDQHTMLVCDYSYTLMLSSPDAYEGGELEIESNGFLHNIKLGAGDMVIYPSNDMHEVKQVTEGSRVACVGWINSSIKSYQDQEIISLFEDMYLSLEKYHLSNEDSLKVGFLQNKIQHLVSK